MLKNYLKTAWQNLRSHKAYAAINTMGLAVGIAACLLVFLLIQHETSFDNFHKSKERIYRVVAVTQTPDGINYSQGSALPVAEGLRVDYPQLEHVARIYDRRDQQITVLDDKANTSQKKFKENVFYVEPEFFSIFNFPFLSGNPETALSEPNTAVISQAIAEKYFGDWQTAINKFIKYNNDQVYKVTGVLKNVPANTDFPPQIVLSFKSMHEEISMDWASQDGSLNTFLVLPENMSAQQFDKDLKAFVKKHAPAEYANHGYMLQPLSDIHYNSKFGTYSGKTFSKELIAALGLVGIFLLIIACINFINLATARAVSRSKEVGIRKVLGSSKKQLVIQFLSETLLITLASVIIAIGFAFSALSLLNNLLQISVNIQFSFPLIVFLFILIISVTFLSGFYPAIVLSGFNPINVLKNKFTSKTTGGLSMRRVLVVFQFAVAQTLIIGTLIVVGQMNLFQNAAMGFDKDAIVTVPLGNDSKRLSKMDAIKAELLQQAGIKNVSLSAFSAMDKAGWDSDFKFDNALKKSDFKADFKWADADYFKTYNIQFIAGKPYSQADSVNGFVVNEMMVKKLGFQNPEDIIGKRINFFDGNMVAPVVGVVKNFNGSSLEKEMTPVVLGSFKMVYRLINIKIEPQNVKQTLATIERLWNKAYPDFIYEYQFLDDKIASFYKREHQLSQLFKIAAGIAIFISCLGLYGFVSFMAVQRTKEVGIRKVLGASVTNIIYLISKEFTLLIGIAFLIATPLAYYVMHYWLQRFAYRIDIGIEIFLLTILISEIIAWVTVGYQAVKAAIANPVKSLRME
ncbi:ABC transporter permease [Chitinophaga filiformis]|uniref:Duplicated orphan permease n=1 Tax=Chitinophaga filiformis TaxID=104663 RepID=A0A1G7H117_CHIFI|nr:ABC transporter permease [Chitinophaga filiformis]SDE94108.1 duplicated orphan permease [Chitinophaga filiformis]